MRGNHSVTGGKLQRMKVWRKGQEVPRLGGPGDPLGTTRRLFLRGGAGAKATRIPLRRVGTSSESLPIPADASGAYRPNPPATTELAPGPPSLKGYHAGYRSAKHFEECWVYNGSRNLLCRRRLFKFANK
jgi:hypothetical protein